MDKSRMQQPGRRTSEHRIPITDEEVFNEGVYDEYDDVTPSRMSSSARRYQGTADVRAEVGRKHADAQPFPPQRKSYVVNTGYQSNIGRSVPPRRTATQTNIPAVQSNRERITHTDEVRSRRGGDGEIPRHRFHWLVFVGLAMFVMILGWIALSAFSNWWQVTQDDWHYGRPRTFQTNAVVGHNDFVSSPSHFIALNLNSRVEIIEFPGGDPSKVKIYIGPMLIGQGQDLAAVTLSFKDVNGDGKLDMIVNVQNSRFVYINENGSFRPARPNENVQL